MAGAGLILIRSTCRPAGTRAWAGHAGRVTDRMDTTGLKTSVGVAPHGIGADCYQPRSDWNLSGGQLRRLGATQSGRGTRQDNGSRKVRSSRSARLLWPASAPATATHRRPQRPRETVVRSTDIASAADRPQATQPRATSSRARRAAQLPGPGATRLGAALLRGSPRRGREQQGAAGAWAGRPVGRQPAHATPLAMPTEPGPRRSSA